MSPKLLLEPSLLGALYPLHLWLRGTFLQSPCKVTCQLCRKGLLNRTIRVNFASSQAVNLS